MPSPQLCMAMPWVSYASQQSSPIVGTVSGVVLQIVQGPRSRWGMPGEARGKFLPHYFYITQGSNLFCGEEDFSPIPKKSRLFVALLSSK